jgi:hypothetical protein
MLSGSLTSAQVLTLLSATPQRLEALTTDLAPTWLRTTPSPDAWSANEVLAHLRACADMWGSCIMATLAEERPTLRAINPRTWIDKTDYLDLAFQPSLDAFATQRSALLAVLEPLPPEGWSRAATVTGAGKALERTVLDYGRRLALHERPHLKQIERIVKRVGEQQATKDHDQEAFRP